MVSATSSVSGITALQALTDVGGVEAGQRVLVVGASGGVGTFAVQLARSMGAHVDGVAGTAKLDLVRSLGADEVFDHRTTDLADLDREYDLVLDIGGRNRLRTLRRLLTPTGTLVIVGGEDGNRLTGGIGRQLRALVLSPFVSQRLTAFVSKEHHSFVETIAAHLAAGSVVPVVAATHPLEQTAEALRALGDRRIAGKAVIIVGDA